jgi:branched-subunit amino acid permease
MVSLRMFGDFSITSLMLRLILLHLTHNGLGSRDYVNLLQNGTHILTGYVKKYDSNFNLI